MTTATTATTATTTRADIISAIGDLMTHRAMRAAEVESLLAQARAIEARLNDLPPLPAGVSAPVVLRGDYPSLVAGRGEDGIWRLRVGVSKSDRTSAYCYNADKVSTDKAIRDALATGGPDGPVVPLHEDPMSQVVEAILACLPGEDEEEEAD